MVEVCSKLREKLVYVDKHLNLRTRQEGCMTKGHGRQPYSGNPTVQDENGGLMKRGSRYFGLRHKAKAMYQPPKPKTARASNLSKPMWFERGGGRVSGFSTFSFLQFLQLLLQFFRCMLGRCKFLLFFFDDFLWRFCQITLIL